MLGEVASTLNAWLLLRGLRTLDLRLERSAASAEKIIGFLETRQEIERIYYPFYPGNPQYELARRQMKRGGGLFTVALRRSEEHTSELQSLMRISYAVFCLKKKKHKKN